MEYRIKEIDRTIHSTRQFNYSYEHDYPQFKLAGSYHVLLDQTLRKMDTSGYSSEFQNYLECLEINNRNLTQSNIDKLGWATSATSDQTTSQRLLNRKFEMAILQKKETILADFYYLLHLYKLTNNW